ncbi:MAG: tol-pal system protein YbgF [Candidatus Mariimomonas ferrooxydans]
MYFLLCALFFMLILAGCATPEDIGRMQYDLINLRSKVNDIESRVPGQGGQLNERLAGLEEGREARNRSVSDMLMNVQSLTAELQMLTGRFDELQYSSEKSSKELTGNNETITARIKKLETAINELKEKLAVLELQRVSPEKQKTVEKAKKTDDEGKTPETEAKDIYMEAYRTFKEEKFKAAREQFEALLGKYPESELSDNARFWIGESYYRGKNYEDAILAYQELFDNNPQSDKVPGALLKQGLAFYELKKERIGKTILDQLIEKFPDSEQAGIAKKKLNPARDTKKKQ